MPTRWGSASRDEVHRGGAPLAAGIGWGAEAVLEDVDVVGDAVFPRQHQRGTVGDHQVVAAGTGVAQMWEDRSQRCRMSAAPSWGSGGTGGPRSIMSSADP